MNNVETRCSKTDCSTKSADGSGQSANQLYAKYEAWHKHTKQTTPLKSFKVWLEDAIKTGLLTKQHVNGKDGYFAATGSHGRVNPSRVNPSLVAPSADGVIPEPCQNDSSKNKDKDPSKHFKGRFYADAAAPSTPTKHEKKTGVMEMIKTHKKAIIITAIGIVAIVVIVKVVKKHGEKAAA